MRLPGMGRLGKLARRVRNIIDPGAIILLYHRIAEVDSDPWWLSVTPQHFAQQLEVLRQHVSLLSLSELNKQLQEGTLSRSSIAITFDDGYGDNFHNAKPLLEKYDIPATVFIASGYIGSDREFWWDELERLLLQPGTLPETLTINCNGNKWQWELGATAHYSEEDYQRNRTWKADKPPTNSRQLLYRQIWEKLQPLTDEEQKIVLDQIQTWAGVNPEARNTHRPLSHNELIDLEKGELIEIGAHTISHPRLSAHSLERQRDEIKLAKAQLEQLIGKPVMSFAYPSGDYTPDTIEIVSEAGFTCACSTIVNSIHRKTDRFQLPRVEVKDWDGDEFAKRLSRWFDV